MTPGSLLLIFRQTFGHGLRAAYYRDVVRPRILRTPPITGTTDKTCEIHVLTCASDWLNLVWVLKSFYAASGKRYALCIHEDGSLEPEQIKTLAAHFPDARIITRKIADEIILPMLQKFPRCLELRRTKFISFKEFDFPALAKSERLLYLDSDILFFTIPEALIQRIENSEYKLNTFNGDEQTAYSIEPAVLEKLIGFGMLERINSGLGLVQRQSVNWEWIEEFLNLPGMLDHPWRFEQTLLALCSCRYGVELLPKEYDVHLTGGIDGTPCRHYVGTIRHLFYGEGIHRLLKNGILRN